MEKIKVANTIGIVTLVISVGCSLANAWANKQILTDKVNEAVDHKFNRL